MAAVSHFQLRTRLARNLFDVWLFVGLVKVLADSKLSIMSCQNFKQNLKHSTIYQEIFPSCCVPILLCLESPVRSRSAIPIWGWRSLMLRFHETAATKKGCLPEGWSDILVTPYLSSLSTMNGISTWCESSYIFSINVFFLSICDVFLCLQSLHKCLTSPIFTWTLFPLYLLRFILIWDLTHTTNQQEMLIHWIIWVQGHGNSMRSIGRIRSRSHTNLAIPPKVSDFNLDFQWKVSTSPYERVFPETILWGLYEFMTLHGASI